MTKCLLCNKELKSNRGLSLHVTRFHKINRYEYDKKNNLLCFCKVCGVEICCLNKTGCCTHCRDRNGENNPFFNKTHTKETRKILSVKTSKNNKELWKDKIYRDKVIKGTSKPRSDKFKKEQSERTTKWFKDNPEEKQIRSKNMKNYWKEGIIISNNFSCNKSKLEKEFYNLLLDFDKNLIVNHTLYFNKKWFFPDIINLEKNIIIEFFGDYWHCNPKFYTKDDKLHINVTAEYVWNFDKERIKIFKNLGFKVFIVWEYDFKNNKQMVLDKFKYILESK